MNNYPQYGYNLVRDLEDFDKIKEFPHKPHIREIYTHVIFLSSFDKMLLNLQQEMIIVSEKDLRETFFPNHLKRMMPRKRISWFQSRGNLHIKIGLRDIQFIHLQLDPFPLSILLSPQFPGDPLTLFPQRLAGEGHAVIGGEVVVVHLAELEGDRGRGRGTAISGRKIELAYTVELCKGN